MERLAPRPSTRKDAQNPVTHQLSHTHRPPTIVRSIGILMMLYGSSLNTSRPSTTRSANLPGSIDPLRFSSSEAKAPCTVPTRIASSSVILSSGPRHYPWRLCASLPTPTPSFPQTAPEDNPPPESPNSPPLFSRPPQPSP